MLIDAHDLAAGDHALTAQVCVVGGGIAGSVIALELARAGVDVVVLESGGLASDSRTDDLSQGESADLAYEFGFHQRSRLLGGGGHCWSGWSRPLEPEDFARRSWVSHSGWPLDRDALLPYYDRARDVLRIGDGQPETMELDATVVRTSVSHFADVAAARDAARAALETDRRITVVLHANLTSFEVTESGSHVTAAAARTLDGGRSVHVRAERFVLATGGIENARLLLAAGSTLAVDRDLVGRYFMDHPRRLCGEVHARAPGVLDRYERSRRGSGGAAAAFVVPPQVQEREGLLNARAGLRTMPVGESTPTVESMRRLRRLVRQRDRWGADHRAELANVVRHPWTAAGFVAGRTTSRRPFVRGTQLELIVEPTPDPDSRVSLSTERDALGMPRARVDWRLSDHVRHTFERTAEIIATELSRAGLADVELAPVDAESWRDEVEGTWHHLGTTRMAASPRDGVVDTDARVHGVDNLYVAGSSVFPTAGANFPTLTLTALALRLADHLVAARHT